MTNNLNTTSGVDRIQAAASIITAREKEKEATERAAAHTIASRRGNPVAAAAVAKILGQYTATLAVETEEAEAPRTTQGLEVEQPLSHSTEAHTLATVQDEVPQPEHPSPEPAPPESEPIRNEVTSQASVAVQLPAPAREFGLLTRADVQAEPSAIPLIHGLISKGQLVMIAGPSGSGKSVFQLLAPIQI